MRALGRVGAAAFTAAALTVLAPSCVPNLGSGDSLITQTQILAIRAAPAEAVPGTKTTFTSLVASPSGPVSGPDVQWNFCTAPLPLTEDNVVSNVCLEDTALIAAGAGPSVVAKTPPMGCSLYGPDAPANGGFRPPDPDATGGYYQPLRADVTGADSAFALVRIHCDLASAGADAAKTFTTQYTLNQNPTLLPLTATIAGHAARFDAIPAGSMVTVEAAWPSADAETYAYFDVATQSVTTQREAMQVAWYSTTGSFATEATGRASTDMTATSDDTWTAPAAAGTGTLFVVLRDSRGGVDFATVAVTITPPS